MEEKEIVEDKKKKEQYINNFAETFEIKNIKIDTTKMPLLSYIIRELGEDLQRPSEEFKKLSRKKIEIYDKLEKTFTEEQKEMFLEYWETDNSMFSELEGQLFMYGFIMAQELENEKNNIKR